MSAPPIRPGRPMDGLTRRTLLRASGVAGAAALLAGAGKIGLDAVLGRAASDPLPTGTPILLVVTLYGGNDGLNTVVPYADPAYLAARPTLGYAADTVLHLDGSFGLNPGMAHTATEFASGRVAVVHGAGYPQPDHSHFRSMDIWQTGSPSTPSTSGWLGRWLDAAGGDPLLAVNVGEVLPPLLVGESSCAAALSTAERSPGPAVTRALAALAVADPADPPAARLVTDSYAAYGRVATLRTDAAASGASGASGGGKAGLAADLDLVARCIRAGAPTRVYAASLSGFDTHTAELARQTALLTELDTALDGFRTALAGHERAADVVTLVYSEFGRRVAANASEGTDHGTAGPVLLLGDRVRGGFHGDPPSLTALDDGDLAFTTDFRSVYAEVLQGVLGTDPTRVLAAGSPAAISLLR